ncbi:MAG TPA: response regulator, partial [Planctomycetaceae bacterium]
MVRAVRQPEPSPRPTAAEDGRPLAGVRVLVADDDRIPRRIAAAAVLRAGGEPVEAEDGVAALALWAAGGLTRPAFDAALLDFVMPGLDGADLIRTLRDLG